MLLDPDEVNEYDSRLAIGDSLTVEEQRLLMAMCQMLTSQHVQIESVLQGLTKWPPILEWAVEAVEKIIHPPGLGTVIGDPDDPYVDVQGKRAARQDEESRQAEGRVREQHAEMLRRQQEWQEEQAKPLPRRPLQLVDHPPAGLTVMTVRETPNGGPWPPADEDVKGFEFVCGRCGKAVWEMPLGETFEAVMHCTCGAYNAMRGPVIRHEPADPA